jgi:hypothetical protein
VGAPIVLTMGRRGTPSLWILGSPYSLGGLEPLGIIAVDIVFNLMSNQNIIMDYHLIAYLIVLLLETVILNWNLFILSHCYPTMCTNNDLGAH